MSFLSLCFNTLLSGLKETGIRSRKKREDIKNEKDIRDEAKVYRVGDRKH